MHCGVLFRENFIQSWKNYPRKRLLDCKKYIQSSVIETWKSLMSFGIYPVNITVN